MFSSDLVPLLSRQPTPDVRLRQGVIVSWNANTGENVVDVGGTQMENLPILNTGEAIALKAGHIVTVIFSGPTAYIQGRVTFPGDPDFASASVAFGAARATAEDFGLVQGTPTNMATAVITVPTWADEAAVIGSATTSIQNTRAVIDFARLRLVTAGVAGADSVHGFAPNGHASGNYYQTFSSAQARVVTSPGASISVTAQMWVDGAAWPASLLNLVAVDAIAIFRSTT